MPAIASQCQSLPASTAHYHSIVSKQFLYFISNDYFFLLNGNTMKNTMRRKSFKMLENIWSKRRMNALFWQQAQQLLVAAEPLGNQAILPESACQTACCCLLR